MTRFLPYILICVLVGVAGCDKKTALGKASAQLKAGMSRAEVAALFTDFSPHEPTAFDHRPEDMHAGREQITIFQKNVGHGTNVTYWPHSGGGLLGVWFECCYVYFDTNGTIVAYQYSKD